MTRTPSSLLYPQGSAGSSTAGARIVAACFLISLYVAAVIYYSFTALFEFRIVEGIRLELHPDLVRHEPAGAGDERPAPVVGFLVDR